MKTITILTFIICTIICVGCQSTFPRETAEGTHPPIRIDHPNTTIRFNSVSLTDDSIARKIGVDRTDWRRTNSGAPQSWAVLRNRTDFPMQIECRTHYFDETGRPVEDTSSWHRLFLSANTFATYQETATSSYARYYYIEVREAR